MRIIRPSIAVALAPKKVSSQREIGETRTIHLDAHVDLALRRVGNRITAKLDARANVSLLAECDPS